MAKLLFFKGSQGNIWDKFICLITNSAYSHVELQFPNGKCWSSSTYDGGVRAKYIDMADGHWDTLECPTPSEKLFLQEVGKEYDYIGLIGTVIRVPWFSRQRKWFCSEIVAEALGLENSWKYTPEDIYQIYK